MKLRIILASILLLTVAAFAQLLAPIRMANTTAVATTVTFLSYCDSGSSSTGTLTCVWAATPTAGKGVAIVNYSAHGATISTVCDGTGTGGCTGSSTYTCNTTYANGTAYDSHTCYTCNFAGSTSVTVTYTGAVLTYGMGMSMSGQSTSGCLDGYAKNQSTSATTAYTTGAITPTNSHDLFAGFFTNNCGGTYVVGTDGQGNALTFSDASGGTAVSGVPSIQYKNESTIAAFTASTTGPSCVWNGEAMAFK